MVTSLPLPQTVLSCGSLGGRPRRAAGSTISSKDPAFEQALIDTGVYTCDYSHPHGPQNPSNFDEILETMNHRRPSLSSSNFGVDEFQNFQTDISGTENRINVARRDFNEAVNQYNLKVKTFPNNIFAGIFGFHEKPYYKSDPGSENAPEIHFDIK